MHLTKFTALSLYGESEEYITALSSFSCTLQNPLSVALTSHRASGRYKFIHNAYNAYFIIFCISLNNSTLLFLLGKFDHKCPYLFWLQFDIINVHSLNLLDDLLLLINIPPEPLHIGQRHVAVQRGLRDPGGGAEGGEDLRSAANRLIGEVVQSRRRPLLGPSPG